MSIHSSLRGIDTLKGERSVFTRVERLAVLKKDGRFKEENGSIYGLPKVRTRFKTVGVKKAEKPKADAAATVAGGTVAAPAKGAAAAAATAAKGAAAPAADKKAAEKKK